MVTVTPEKQQLIGVRVASVERGPVSTNLRILGRVVEDETRVASVNATVEGWIVHAKPYPTWTFVKRNQVLATFYSQEYLMVGAGLTYTLTAKERQEAAVKEGRDPKYSALSVDLEEYKESLRNLGMGEAQIENLLRKRRFMEKVEITAPIDGFLTVRNITTGSSFRNGDLLYQVSDLRRVWVLADTFEDEARYLKPGQEVRVVHPVLKKGYPARVSAALPQFDDKARTLRVRLEMDNPDYVFKPGMFADLEVPLRLPPSITVPGDALIDAGLARRVYLERAPGVFEPREVETGRRFGDRVEITRGLQPGDRVVVSGTFLIDSESRMEKAAAGDVGTVATDPVCGVPVSLHKAEKNGLKSFFKGKDYYFHSADCRDRFNRSPDRYTTPPNHAEPLSKNK
jgi:RND family efflux transporter MFP subunit